MIKRFIVIFVGRIFFNNFLIGKKILLSTIILVSPTVEKTKNKKLANVNVNVNVNVGVNVNVDGG